MDSFSNDSDDLIMILARIKQRLQSEQKSKWKRIRKVKLTSPCIWSSF